MPYRFLRAEIGLILRPRSGQALRLLLGLAALSFLTFSAGSETPAAKALGSYSFGVENSWIRIQNIGDADANIELKYYDESGRLTELESPYPGGNLFSLASGGAIYLRDPHRKVEDEQLNGGRFVELSQADWDLIEPYLRENERQFGIAVEDLLTVDGVRRDPPSAP